MIPKEDSSISLSVPPKKTLRAKWYEAANAVGDFNSRVILTLVYFLVVAPVGLCVRLLRDPLRLRGKRASTWISRMPPDVTIENARRQG